MKGQFTTFRRPCSSKETLSHLLTVLQVLGYYIGALILSAALFMASDAALASIAPELHLEKSVSASDIDRYVGYYADTQGNQQLNDILINPNIFIPVPEKRFAFNVHTHWYKANLINPKNSDTRWHISTGISSAPFLKAYWINDISGDIRVISNSRNPTKEEKKRIRFSGYIIPLNLEPGERGSLIVEYQSVANFQLRIKMYAERDIIDRGLQLMMLNGVYAGIISVFCVFFFAQFLIRPTRTTGYYTLFIFTLIAFMGQINGYGIQSIWPSLKQYNSLLSSFLGGSIYIWYFLFTARIFQLEQQNKRLYFVMIGLCAAILFLIVLGILIPTDYPLSVLVAFGLPWPSIVAIWAVRQKHPSAKIFLLGSCIHCVTTYLFMLTCLGIPMGDNSFIFALASAGQLIDIICFSIAIFFRQNKIRKQYHHQVELRLSDMQSLSESEQLSAQMLSLSKEKVLQTAATIHDLRQPLAAIRLTLATQDPDQAPIRNMQSALSYADNLLNSVLKTSKVDYHKMQEAVSVSNLIAGISQRHYAIFQTKDVQLRVFCPDIEITCLPIVINRIVDNLLANAVRYTESGTVLLSGRKRANNRFLIQIWDTGQGIPAAQIHKILSPFKQLNADDIENMGFGLGLFIVKSLCDEAGYELDIRSQVGKGSCFSILLTDTNIKVPCA